MDFISESDTEDERQFESKVLADIKNFVLVMGKGFCFIGNQYRVDVHEEEFFIVYPRRRNWRVCYRHGVTPAPSPPAVRVSAIALSASPTPAVLRGGWNPVSLRHW